MSDYAAVTPEQMIEVLQRQIRTLEDALDLSNAVFDVLGIEDDVFARNDVLARFNERVRERALEQHSC